jgi:hypothetical protein
MFHKLLLATSLVVGYASSGFAAITVFESFNYGPGDLAGHGAGSIGFSDNWSGHSSFDITPGGLSSPVSFPESTGNRLTTDAFGDNRDILRTLAQPFGADNSTIYLSYLMQAEDVVGAGAYSGWFSFTLRSNQGYITIGKESFSNRYKIESGVGHIAHSNVNVVANQTHLFVIRADFQPGADEFRLYIDPPTGQAEPLSAAATLNLFDFGTVDTIGLSGPGAFGFDELRIGTAWLDVAPKLSGDYNANGTVDAADYIVWRNSVGSMSDFRADGTGPRGTPDQVIDDLDYNFWKQRYHETRESGTMMGYSQIVPEPATHVLMLIAILVGALRRVLRPLL